jgi:hypothetical protein
LGCRLTTLLYECHSRTGYILPLRHGFGYAYRRDGWFGSCGQERHILIKGGDTIEAVANTKYVVFDKTGTLTTGKFSINEIKAEPGVDIELDPGYDHRY